MIRTVFINFVNYARLIVHTQDQSLFSKCLIQRLASPPPTHTHTHTILLIFPLNPWTKSPSGTKLEFSVQNLITQQHWHTFAVLRITGSWGQFYDDFFFFFFGGGEIIDGLGFFPVSNRWEFRNIFFLHYSQVFAKVCHCAMCLYSIMLSWSVEIGRVSVRREHKGVALFCIVVFAKERRGFRPTLTCTSALRHNRIDTSRTWYCSRFGVSMVTSAVLLGQV